MKKAKWLLCVCARGVRAFSCDILSADGGHPEWHIKSDVNNILDGMCKFKTEDGKAHFIVNRWDMIIAFPPCTYLSNAGAKHLFRGGKLNQERYQKGLEAKQFFLTLYNAKSKRIAVENPISSRIFEMPEYTQEIQPFHFGHPVQKKTRLWLKGLPNLVPTSIVEPNQNCHDADTWFMKGGKDRQRNRARTFSGIAEAMAEQWT